MNDEDRGQVHLPRAGRGLCLRRRRLLQCLLRGRSQARPRHRLSLQLQRLAQGSHLPSILYAIQMCALHLNPISLHPLPLCCGYYVAHTEPLARRLGSKVPTALRRIASSPGKLLARSSILHTTWAPAFLILFIWNDVMVRAYCALQVQRLGRQILEALLFLQERGFPPFGHLHSGNVIIQNGVAR